MFNAILQHIGDMFDSVQSDLDSPEGTGIQTGMPKNQQSMGVGHFENVFQLLFVVARDLDSVHPRFRQL